VENSDNYGSRGKIKMRIIYFGLLFQIVFAVCFSDELSDYQAKQRKEVAEYSNKLGKSINDKAEEYDRYRVLSEKEFQDWKDKQEREYKEFKDNIEKQWGSYEQPTNKDWVEYGKDNNTVSNVNFETGTVKVKALKLSGESNEAAQERLKHAIERLLESKGSMTTVPVETADTSLQICKKPILESQVVGANGKTADAGTLLKEEKANISVVPLENGKGDAMVFTFSLAPDNLKKRMEPYIFTVKKYCNKYDVNIAHALATIHTESYFNPAARSGCGAIGLMQLMPERGGAEAYAYVKRQKKIPTEPFLYDAQNNIELGCAYISLLEKKYFNDVGNDLKRIYCAVAGYNTGPGNVSYAIVGQRKVNAAIVAINNMASNELYTILIDKLPYAETRDYLKKVVDRMSLYK
jgi:membrane-bound lytic murein transglycosylase C